MEIIIIAAVAENGAIGNKGKLLWRLPDDMKRFKQLTTGNTVIMGRKTFDTFPNGALPNRRNIVLSRQQGIELDGAEVYNSLDEALAHCETDETIYIIGGGIIYTEALPYATQLRMTEVADTPAEADAFFPKNWKEGFELVKREHHESDERHAVAFDFTDYKKSL